MNYKNTLNLPQTKFSMKANLSQMEPQILTHWQNLNVYHQLRQARKNKKKFILHDGPPYANGLIHIGHALNKILKDIIIKYKVMQGFDIPFIIGWDCHGLPVEHQLFKELGLTKHDVDVVDFRKKAKDFALKYVKLQSDDFKRLGLFTDWDNPYLTLARDYEYGVIKLLEYLVQEGFIYRGQKPVNWCGVCETALAEAEVEYTDKQSDSIYVLFPLKDDQGLFKAAGKIPPVYFLIWTTTPWTLVANSAVAVHPRREYCLTEMDNKLFLLGKDLAPRLEKELKLSFKILETFPGNKLEHLTLNHPFLERKSPVVTADFVSVKEGSGCVHIAPGHGEEDFSLTKKYSLPIIMPVDDKGIFQDPAAFKGKSVAQVNNMVIEKLKEKNLLFNHQKITHSYPHCWRCQNPIIFRTTYQWFLNVEHKNLREKLINELDNVTWFPARSRERMKTMLQNRPDWCLSRQRLWGIPIPAIRCKSCSAVTLDKGVINKTAAVFKEAGSDAWFTLDLGEFLPAHFACPQCKSKEFQKEFDILDVWFESGASFLSVVKNNPQLRFPADMYLEGSDQHRGWFQVSLIPSVAQEKKAPFKMILTHGFVVDGDGKKMSKSLGNVVSAQEITKNYGAEILRLWTAYSDYSEDIKISPAIIDQLVDIYRKVRNTIRFILGNLYDFDIRTTKMNHQNLLEVDRFILAKTMTVGREVISFYDNFSFYKAAQAIFNFCNMDLSSFYLDILKDRLYTYPANSQERRSGQFVLHHILALLLKMIAPILSFTAEEVCRLWDGVEDKSIFLSTFAESLKPQWIDEKLLLRWQKILSLRDKVLREIEKERGKGVIGSSLQAQVHLSVNEEDYSFYRKYEDILREIFIVSRVTIEKGEAQIKINPAGGQRCLRCWNWRQDVNQDESLGQVCKKCSAILAAGTN